MKRHSILLLALLAACAGALFYWIRSGGGLPSPPEYAPDIKPASEEAQSAIQTMQAAPGFQIGLVAAEPMLANPVAFDIDPLGRIYVAETFRLHAGVTDMRDHPGWVVEDLAIRTVEERLTVMRKNLGDDFESYRGQQDRLRLLEDADGDGKSDRATVFAGEFDDFLDGIGSGVLADQDGSVYFTIIPDLLKLQDRDGDGTADVQEKLSTGYGVRFNFIGHDLHGLIKGPDGKIYFTVGDRGLHVTSGATTLAYPDTGAVLRCNPDGSELEVIHIGLRNPQELAFDDHGNLFTGDNNSDSGDQARWVQVVEGGHSGWLVGYQWLQENPIARGPWNAERLWYPRFEGQAAYIVPPITNIGAGPSGLAYYPGTGLPDKYRGYFFLADFRGSPSSRVHAFTLKPKGASFEMVDRHDFLVGPLVTDLDFGHLPGLFFSDWVEGWRLTGKGRIYRAFDPALESDPSAAEASRLLREGFSERPAAELLSLLEHMDRRVRLEAQYALAELGQPAIDGLGQTAASSPAPLARLHAIWSLGQIGRKSGLDAALLISLLDDADPEVRAQAVKTLGELRVQSAESELIKLLSDPSPRVRFFAASSAGKIGSSQFTAPLVEMIRRDQEGDPYLRHAASMGLAGTADAAALVALREDTSAAVRLAAVLGLRRQGSPLLGEFLSDPDPAVQVEAARAIYDLPVPDAYPALAAKIGEPAFLQAAFRNSLSEDLFHDLTAREQLEKENGAIRYYYPLLRRALHINYRLGGPAQARALAELAARRDAYPAARLEALDLLRRWSEASVLDTLLGIYRPVGARSDEPVRQVLPEVMPRLLSRGVATSIQEQTARLAAQYRLQEAASLLMDRLKDQESAPTQVAALEAIQQLDFADKEAAIALGRRSPFEETRGAALRLLFAHNPARAVTEFSEVLKSGSAREQQVVFQLLKERPMEEASSLLVSSLERLRQNKLAPEVQLDLLEAAEASQATQIQQALAAYRSSLPGDDPLARFRPTLQGGDAALGRKVFRDNAGLECQRCHSLVPGRPDMAGPGLADIGARADRQHILESIVDPNAKISPGYENVSLVLKDGSRYRGRVVEESSQSLILEISQEDDGFATGLEAKPHSLVDVVAEGPAGAMRRISVRQADIQSRKRNLSSMPEGLADQMSKQDLRNLVEFLAGLKGRPRRGE